MLILPRLTFKCIKLFIINYLCSLLCYCFPIFKTFPEVNLYLYITILKRIKNLVKPCGCWVCVTSLQTILKVKKTQIKPFKKIYIYFVNLVYILLYCFSYGINLFIVCFFVVE